MRGLVALLFFLGAFLATARADIQFDVFLGYGDLGGGGIIPEASWFPVVGMFTVRRPPEGWMVPASSSN